MTTGDEFRRRVAGLSDSELMREAAEWLSDSLSAHYDCNMDPPSEGAGKAYMGELFTRADRKPEAT